MKKSLLIIWLCAGIYTHCIAGTAALRAATLNHGMNLASWLEDEYYFNSTTQFPEAGRFTESDIANLKSLCFQSVRLPVIFEAFASPTAPYAFQLSNANVVRGLNAVDSVIKWCADNNMVLIIDNHIADDNGSIDQTDYQITNSNYLTQAKLLAAVWKQVIARFGYANPNTVIFEIRNEPNVVSDANLRTVYQTVIDTIRVYDKTHTLVTGCSGYYDPFELAQSTPYSDTNIIYTTHIYDGDGYYGFCEQGTGGVNATDSIAGTHISFPASGEVAEINTEMQTVSTWSKNNHVPVWLGEFGCTTLPDVYRDDTSRCNYITAMGAAIDATGMPWAYWDGYGGFDYVSGFGNPTPLYYGFSIFDVTNILNSAHMNSCFATALHVGPKCNTATSININFNITKVNCAGQNTGAITAVATGGSGTYAYVWSNSATTATISNLGIGTYAITVTSTGGQSATASATVSAINPSPTVVDSATGPTTFCQGGSVTLGASASSGAAYKWTTGATTSGISVASSGTYNVTVTNTSGCTAVGQPITVTVNPLPLAVDSINTPTTFCQGGSVTLNVYNAGGTTFLWSNGATTPTTVVTTSGTYNVTVTNNSGCHAAATPITVTVNPLPLAVDSTNTPTTFCQGGSVTLDVYNAGGTTFLWSNGATTPTTVVTSSGTYNVTVTNSSACSAAAQPITVTVNPLPLAVDSTNTPTTFCQGGSVTLDVYNAGGTTFLWSNGATTASTVVNTSGTYNVTVTNASGCHAAAQPITVTVNPLPLAIDSTNTTTTFCQGGSVTLDVYNAGGTTFLWSNGATTPTTVVTTAGTYNVTVTNASGCHAAAQPITVTVNSLPLAVDSTNTPTTFCQGGSVTLDVYNAGGTTFLWSNGATTASTVVNTSGTYNVTVTNSSGCSAAAQPITVTINPLPLAVDSTNTPTTFCQGGSVTLDVYNAGGTTFLWSNGATTASTVVNTSGTYNVTVTNSSGCSAAAQPIIVTVNAKPTAVISPSGPVTFCKGGQVTLTATAGTGYIYKWSNAATNEDITVTVSGNYSVTITSAAGCTASSGATKVQVNVLPTATITASGATTFCAGGSVTLTALAGTGYSYLWSTGVTTNAINVNTSGSYTYTVTNAGNCQKVSAAKKVTVEALPTVKITVTKNTVCSGGTAILTATTGTGYAYKWSTGSTTKADTAKATGVYVVTVTNTKTCSATASTDITCTTGAVAGKATNDANNGNGPNTSGVENFNVSVYPNPYSGQFHLKIVSSTTDNIYVKIFDVDGRLLEERKEIAYGADIILGNGYAAGVYLVQVQQGSVSKEVKVVKTE